MIMETILAIIAMLCLAKKREPRWKQTTFTDGAHKGAVDWLKNGTQIEPCEIEVGTALDLIADGYDIPDFVIEKGPKILIVILTDRTDNMRRPLLVHQPTAVRGLLIWLGSVDGIFTENGQIDVLCTDEEWKLTFTRGKGQFAPYVLGIEGGLDDDKKK